MLFVTNDDIFFTNNLDTTPQDTRPYMWRQYINDSFEVVKGNKEDEVTKHLNSIDTHHQQHEVYR